MTRRIVRDLFALSIAGLALTSCATFATHDEYQSYRAVRMADEDRERLVALQQYAETYPTGMWAEEVSSLRAAREEETWASSNTSREGLEWYLRVYPDGQYVEQARPRLAALQTVGNRREEEAERQRELEAQQRAAAAEERRTWVTRAMQFWLRNLVGIRQYGSSLGRIAQSNAEFSSAFGNAPQPVCTPEYCIKHYGQLYHIPVPGATRLDRHIDVYLRLVLDRGRLRRAELLMPNKGFSRWYEMENQTVVTDEDPEQRQMAINWALDRLQPIIQQAAEGAEQFDYVPEPINPLQVRGDAADTEDAPAAPDEAPAPTPAPTPTETPTETPDGEGAAGEGAAGEGGSVIDDLLEQAAGDEAVTPTEPTPTEPTEVETLVLPISLLSYRYRNLRVVFFAAGDDDYAEAYDGVFLEPATP